MTPLLSTAPGRIAHPGTPVGVPENFHEQPRSTPAAIDFGHTPPMSESERSADHGAEINGETRPWGRFIVLDDTPTCKVKRIIVDPGQRLSYQLHHRRAEHWTVVSGTALVTLNGEDITVEPGASIDIPRGADHRVRNPGD